MILSVCPNPSVDKYLRLPALNAGNVNRSSMEQFFPGGKGVHVALALNELGYKSSLLGFWGGPTGKWIKETCSNYNVNCFGPEIRGWNRTCITINAKNESDQTEILERGPKISSQSIEEFLNHLKKLSEKQKIISISGSWPEGTPENIYSDIKKNLLPQHHLWIDASGKWLEHAVNIEPYGIHVNFSEVETFYGTGKKPDEYALKLLDHCTIAAVTNGADGLYLATRGALYHTICSVENIISTVGSGDCLLAGILIADHNNLNIQKMAVLGTACGTANCLREDLGMLYKKDVERLKQIVTCQKLI